MRAIWAVSALLGRTGEYVHICNNTPYTHQYQRDTVYYVARAKKRKEANNRINTKLYSVLSIYFIHIHMCVDGSVSKWMWCCLFFAIWLFFVIRWLHAQMQAKQVQMRHRQKHHQFNSSGRQQQWTCARRCRCCFSMIVGVSGMDSICVRMWSNVEPIENNCRMRDDVSRER